MNTFKTTDFIQVQFERRLESGEPILFWRNALYVGKQNDNHVVIYTDGDKQVLSCQKIRKVKWSI